MEKLCVNCRHYDQGGPMPNGGYRPAQVEEMRCQIPTGEISLNDNHEIIRYRSPRSERSVSTVVAWLTGACGRSGRFYVARAGHVPPRPLPAPAPIGSWVPPMELPPNPEPAPILSHLDEARLHYESSYRQMLDAKEALEKARGWDSAHPSRE